MTNLSNPGNTPEPADRPAQLPCPSWCCTDHADQDRRQAESVARVRARTGTVPDWMARWHTRTVATIPNPAAGPTMTVGVTLYRDDSLVDPDPNRAVVSAEQADCMNSQTAVELAAGLLAAVAMLRDDPAIADELADGLAKIASRLQAGEPR